LADLTLKASRKRKGSADRKTSFFEYQHSFSPQNTGLVAEIKESEMRKGLLIDALTHLVRSCHSHPAAILYWLISAYFCAE
jgi:hypothetical protein